MAKGMIHIYTGDGKGKTTAAVGLSVRAAGSGMKVLFVQFFKPESDPSGEKDFFNKHSENIEVIRSSARHPFFTGKKTDTDKVGEVVRETFVEATRRAVEEKFDMLVLDEVIGAVTGGFLSEDSVIEFIEKNPEGLEIVLTGREAPVPLVKAADYVTEMLMIKHPFSSGAKARKGIEF